jgi:hypothetical protein
VIKLNKIKNLRDDPVAWYSAPDGVKSIVSMMYKFAPNAFKDPKILLNSEKVQAFLPQEA